MTTMRGAKPSNSENNSLKNIVIVFLLLVFFMIFLKVVFF